MDIKECERLLEEYTRLDASVKQVRDEQVAYFYQNRGNILVMSRVFDFCAKREFDTCDKMF